MPRIKIEGTGTLTNYHFKASGPVEAADGTEPNDKTPGHEAHGEIVGGSEIYSFSGVPMGFYCDDDANAWELNLSLDMGAGFVEHTPTDLNAAEIELRGKGHYRLFIPEPGMILRGETADAPDKVMTKANTMVAGNLRMGTDSWRAWPPESVSGKTDHDVEYRIVNNEADDGWKPLAEIRLSMGF